MRHIGAFAIPLTLTAAPAAFVAESMDGVDMKPASHAEQSPEPVAAEIRKIHLDTGKATLKHGTINDLGMGAMTMMFAMRDKASLENSKGGRPVLTVFGMVDGQPTVMGLRSK